MNISDRLELFVDYALIDTLDGTNLKLHEPRPEGSVLNFDDPWANRGGYVTVLHDGPTYRMYFRGSSTSGSDDSTGQLTCYAESKDGKQWVKPNLSLYEFGGSRNNNIVFFGDGPMSHNFSPFIDTKPGVPDAERFKAIAGTKETGLLAFASADGLRWKTLEQPPIQPPSAPETRYDSQNVGFWSEYENCYCCYFRVFHDGIRAITRTTSPDFISWSEPTLMSYGDTPTEHLYINQTHPYFRAPHIYIALPARFMAGRKVLTDEEGARFEIHYHKGVGYWQDCAEAVLMTSRGGTRYDRTFMEGFIRPGRDRRNWSSRCNYPALGVVATGETEMSIFATRHSNQSSSHIERFSLRTDGFTSVNAPYAGGEMLTKPFTFQGRELVLNYATAAAGHIFVELLTESGEPISQFSRANASALIGDEIERVVSWKDGTDVSSLAGEKVRLRFSMKDSDLYSLRFGN